MIIIWLEDRSNGGDEITHRQVADAILQKLSETVEIFSFFVYLEINDR